MNPDKAIVEALRKLAERVSAGEIEPYRLVISPALEGAATAIERLVAERNSYRTIARKALRQPADDDIE